MGSERAPELHAGAETRTQAQDSSETRKIVRVGAGVRVPAAGRDYFRPAETHTATG
jgi:hypothetical protein